MSGPLYLLDTNVLLALIRGRELGRYIDGYFGLRHGRQRPLVCIVSHGEIWVLARRCNWGAPARGLRPSRALSQRRAAGAAWTAIHRLR